MYKTRSSFDESLMSGRQSINVRSKKIRGHNRIDGYGCDCSGETAAGV